MASEGKRNWQFDFLKGISCVFVVFLHCPFPGTVGDIIIYACRFPVPIFFMITGYYCYSRDSVWIRKKALGIFKMLFFAELFYGMWNCLRTILLGKGGVLDYFQGVEAFGHPVRTLFFGTFFNGTLWYLYAAFWTYCILYFLIRSSWARTAGYFLIPVLLGLQIFGRFYWQNHFDIEADVYLFRSALLFGLPLTMLGSLLASLKERIQRRILWIHSILIVFFGGVVMVAEYFISRQYMDFHLSTVFISTGLFLLAMTYPYGENRLFAVLSYIGRRLSMWIYLSHMFFSGFLNLIAEKTGAWSHPVYTWGRPVYICICSCLFAMLVNGLLTHFARKPQEA